MNLAQFIEWCFSSFEHFIMFLLFCLIVGGCFRPSVTIKNNS